MTVGFLIPYRPDQGHRDMLFNWTTNRLRRLFPDFKIYVGVPDDGPFNRSQAINRAFKQTKGEDIIYVLDGDVMIGQKDMITTIKAAHNSSSFVIPYHAYLKLDQQSTGRFIMFDQAEVDEYAYNYEEKLYEIPNNPYAPPVGGAMAMRSELFKIVGGYDEGFIGWGYEDNAFAMMASSRLRLFSRSGSNLYHLWHPTGIERTWDSSEMAENHNRFELYKKNIEAMRYDYL